MGDIWLLKHSAPPSNPNSIFVRSWPSLVVEDRRIGSFDLGGNVSIDAGVELPAWWGILLRWNGVNPFSLDLIQPLPRHLPIPPKAREATKRLYCEGTFGYDGLFTPEYQCHCPAYTKLSCGPVRGRTICWSERARYMARELLITNKPLLYYIRPRPPRRRRIPIKHEWESGVGGLIYVGSNKLQIAIQQARDREAAGESVDTET